MVQSSNLKELHQLFMSYPEIEQTILFGSRARGDFSERSDIDLIIKAPNISKERWIDLAFRIAELGIDILLWEEAPETLRQRVLKEGRLLYERNQDPRQFK